MIEWMSSFGYIVVSICLALLVGTVVHVLGSACVGEQGASRFQGQILDLKHVDIADFTSGQFRGDVIDPAVGHENVYRSNRGSSE
jgi:hypothetical protein